MVMISNFLVVGVNLLIGTEHGLMLLDRSGQGKVYQLISRRRFQQMEVLEGQNILVTISGKKNRVRVYYLSWLKSKILRTDGLVEVRTLFFFFDENPICFSAAASREEEWLDKCGRPTGSCAFQNRQVRTYQISCDRFEGQYRNICVGT